jgi:hypothetical protein
MIREGEESQEDSLKIRSDENFLEAWLWILRCFLLDFLFSCELDLSKCLNSQSWQTGRTTKIMCRRWKFNQKLKKWTWLHMMRFSFKIMKKRVLFDSEMSFMRFRWKWVFAICGEKVCLMEFDERKSFLSWWKEWFGLRKKFINLSFHT